MDYNERIWDASRTSYPARHKNNENRITNLLKNEFGDELLSADMDYLLNMMTRKERVIFGMKVEGYSNEETAKLCKISIPTVYYYLNKSKKKNIEIYGWVNCT